MRTGLRISSAVVSLLLCVTSVNGEGNPTLGELRTKYVGQRVLIRDVLFGENHLLEWWGAVHSGDRYELDRSIGSFGPISASYDGKEAVVVEVQRSELRVQKATPNALGEIVSDDESVPLLFELIVRFRDGHLAMSSGHPSRVLRSFVLASDRDRHAEAMASGLATTVGQTLYPVAYSKVFAIDAPLGRIVDIYAKDVVFGEHYWQNQVSSLVALSIVTAKYSPDYDLIILKLRTPEGRHVLGATEYREEGSSKAVPATFLEHICGSFLVGIPDDMSPAELEAVRRGTLFTGMTERSLYYSLGYPKKTNDYGKGAKQLIYSDRLVIYLSDARTVTDRQLLDIH